MEATKLQNSQWKTHYHSNKKRAYFFCNIKTTKKQSNSPNAVVAFSPVYAYLCTTYSVTIIVHTLQYTHSICINIHILQQNHLVVLRQCLLNYCFLLFQYMPSKLIVTAFNVESEILFCKFKIVIFFCEWVADGHFGYK